MTTKQKSTVLLDPEHPDFFPLVLGLRIVPGGQSFAFDDYRYEGNQKKYITVGSSPTSDIIIDDPAVSRRHCLIERKVTAVTVFDSGSRNGTFVNGTRVTESVLIPGSVLTIGTTRLFAWDADSRRAIVASSIPSFLQNALIMYDGNVTQTAGAIGVPKSTLAGWLRGKFRKRTPSNEE